MHKPFDDELENKKFEDLYTSITKKLDKMQRHKKSNYSKKRGK